MGQLTTELLVHAARFFLALVFIAAGAAKLFRTGEFEQAVTSYRILPRRFSRPVAVWLPRAELCAGLLLFFGVLLVPAALAVASLLLVFSFAVGVNLARGRKMSCNCFGAPTAEDITWLTVGRNVVLIGMALGVVAVPATALAVWPGFGSASTVVSASGAVAMLFTAIACVLSIALAKDGWRVIKARNGMQSLLPIDEGRGS